MCSLGSVAGPGRVGACCPSRRIRVAVAARAGPYIGHSCSRSTPGIARRSEADLRTFCTHSLSPHSLDPGPKVADPEALLFDCRHPHSVGASSRSSSPQPPYSQVRCASRSTTGQQQQPPPLWPCSYQQAQLPSSDLWLQNRRSHGATSRSFENRWFAARPVQARSALTAALPTSPTTGYPTQASLSLCIKDSPSLTTARFLCPSKGTSSRTSLAIGTAPARRSARASRATRRSFTQEQPTG